MALKPQYQKFVSEFLISFNASQAAIAAGYSEQTAGAQGYRLLNNAEILNAIKQELDTHAMSAAEVLYHLTMIARGDMGIVLNEWGEIDVREAKKQKKSNLIKKYKTKVMYVSTPPSAEDKKLGGDNLPHVETRIEETEIEMYDRLKALELLAKYHNLTNRVIVEDWRTEAIDLIRKGQVEFRTLAEEMGDSLASELFISAGVPAIDAREITAGSAEE